MAQQLKFFELLLGIGLLLIPALEATPWYWPWQSRSSPSIVTISIGNRSNTSTGSNDGGTSIRDLTFNLSRWNGNLTFETNGTEVFVTRGNNGVTNIHINFDSYSASRRKPKNATTTTTASNATQSAASRRKRALFGLPTFTLPSIPIPTLNGTQALLNGNLFSLPETLTNIANNARQSFLQPWQFLQTFITRRLPMLALDSAVSFLAQLYASTAKRLVDNGVNTLGQTMDSLSSVVNGGLNYVEEQVNSAMSNVTQSFKQLSPAGQRCVGQVPDDAVRPVVAKATGCVRDRWNELDGIVNQFLTVVSDTEAAYGGWLRALDGCTAANFTGMNDTALDAAQRSCYVQTIANSVGKLVDIPMRWADLTVRASTAMTNLQPQVGLCVAGVAVEAASIAANLGVRVVLCQVMQ